MADAPEDRDELGQQPPDEEGGGDSKRSRLIVAYAIVSTAVIAAAVLIVVLASGDDDSGETAKGSAHINLNEAIGSTNGIVPDDRLGTTPPAAAGANLVAAAKQAGCKLKLRLPDEGHEHIPAGSPNPGYKTNPPTSGPHVEPPFQQADGAYSETPAEIDVVHSLEHGRMAIQYSSDLDEQDQLALKGLFDTMYGATLLFPNDEMPYDVAATTWTNLLGCPKYEGAATLDAIRAFGKATWGKFGGEPVYAFTFTGPTPDQPAE